MDEQEILSSMKTYVDSQRPATLPAEVSNVDVSNIGRLSAEVWTSRDAVGQLNPRNSGLLNRLVQVAKKMLQRSLSWYTRPLQVFHFNVARSLEEQGVAITAIERALRQLEDRVSKIQNEIPPMVQLACQNDVLQESLRATELAIQEQLSPYVELFRGRSSVVDLGCGRGEFLTLLKEREINAYGVDSDHTACEMARGKCLRIVEDDLFEHLQQLPDRSLDGVFSARVIEYLPRHMQLELISLCSKKLKPGGLIVIETTNPESTTGFGRTAYLDPTHLRAVPPEMLKSALESNSFQDVTICVLAPVEGCLAATQSEGFRSDPERCARILPDASNSLVGSQAYAAVGRRR